MALVALAAEQLTISTTSVGITSTKFEDPNDSSIDLNILMGVFSYDLAGAGGDIYHNGGLDGAASNSGANGEIPETDPNKWKIWGLQNLKDWRAIKDSGAADAVLQIMLYGQAN